MFDMSKWPAFRFRARDISVSKCVVTSTFMTLPLEDKVSDHANLREI
jgi:hypothetical protein